MSNADPAARGAISGVVLVLDAASESHVAIEAAVQLAARAGAPLRAIFVEDESLLNLASLPFTRQATLGAAAEALTPDHVALHLGLAAERARKTLAQRAGRDQVAASFELLRGDAEAAMLAASERDLVVAPGLARSIGAHFRPACRWWFATAMARGAVVLARQARPADGAVVTLLRDRGPASVRLLQMAAQIGASTGRMLTVLAAPATDHAAFAAWIADLLAGHPVRLQIETGPDDPVTLRRRLGELDCRLLAVAAAVAASAGPLRDLVEHSAYDLLIVP